MLLEATTKPDEYNIWMTDDGLEQLRRSAASHRDDLILQLGGYVAEVGWVDSLCMAIYET